MSSFRNCRLALILVLLGLVFHRSAHGATQWQALTPGMDLGALLARKASIHVDSRIMVLRMDPNLWELVFVGISMTGEASGFREDDGNAVPWPIPNVLGVRPRRLDAQ